jgi:uncharacterized protein (DUF342 family)
METAVGIPLQIAISEDRLRAELSLRDLDPTSITAAAILARLCELKVTLPEDATTHISQIAEDITAGKLTGKTTLLVEGRAPQPGKPATFQLNPDEDDPEDAVDDTGRTDFRRSRIVTVQPGDVFGAYTPAVAPQPGVDLFGEPIPAARPPEGPVLGENLRLGEDGTSVVATCAGKVQLTRHEISVIEVVEIKGDVDFNSGNIESPTDVLIQGTIRDTFTVRSAKSVSVQGTIEAANVEAGTHVHVRGGIAARHRGDVVAGGEICAKFCSEADLKAERDITITREAMHSRVYTAKRLNVLRGSLIGGRSYAREGADVNELGNDANVPTRIAIGVDPEVLAEVRKADILIKKKQQAAARIRERVRPLLAELKRLTPEQRQRAAELMFEADQLDAEVALCQKHKADTLAAASPRQEKQPSILVNSWLHRGVTIIIGDRMTTIEKQRRGPLRITRRLVDRVEEIVEVDQVSGNCYILPSYEYDSEAAREAEQRG